MAQNALFLFKNCKNRQRTPLPQATLASDGCAGGSPRYPRKTFHHKFLTYAITSVTNILSLYHQRNTEVSKNICPFKLALVPSQKKKKPVGYVPNQRLKGIKMSVCE